MSQHRYARPSASFLSGLLLPLVCAVLVPSVAAGQQLRPDVDVAGSEWVTIDRVELGSVELDASRLVEVAPDVYQVRTRWRFAALQTSPDGSRYESSVAVRGIDCRQRAAAIISFADQLGGKIVRTEAQPAYAARWDRVNPETIVDRITTEVCRRAPRAPSIAATAVN